MSSQTPIVVIVRHPDYANEITVHNGDVRIIEADLGGSFDITSGHGDADMALQYAEDLEQEVSDLDAKHPARLEIERIVDDIREWAGETTEV